MHLFEKLHEDGNTIILVTHEPEIAARAHRIITIRDGLIEKDEHQIMETLPGYVSIVFILTTLAAVFFLLRAGRAAGLQNLPAKILYFLLPLWIIFQGIVSIGGFYQEPPAYRRG